MQLSTPRKQLWETLVPSLQAPLVFQFSVNVGKDEMLLKALFVTRDKIRIAAH